MNIHRGGLMVFDAELLKWQDPHAFYYVQRVFDLGSYLPPPSGLRVGADDDREAPK